MPYSVKCYEWVRDNFLVDILNDLRGIDELRSKYLNQRNEWLVETELNKLQFVNDYEFDFSLSKQKFARQLCIDFTFCCDDDFNDSRFLDQYSKKISRGSTKEQLVIAFSWAHINWMEFELGCMGKCYYVIEIILKLLKKNLWSEYSEAKLAAILHAENEPFSIIEIPEGVSSPEMRYTYDFKEMFSKDHKYLEKEKKLLARRKKTDATGDLKWHLKLAAENVVLYHQLVTTYPDLQEKLTKSELELMKIVCIELHKPTG